MIAIHALFLLILSICYYVNNRAKKDVLEWQSVSSAERVRIFEGLLRSLRRGYTRRIPYPVHPLNGCPSKARAAVRLAAVLSLAFGFLFLLCLLRAAPP